MARKGSRKWKWDTLIDQVHQNCHPEGDCLVWNGKTDRDGYPVSIYIDGKSWRVARAVLFVFTGEFNEHSMHSCDNPPCLKLEHLKWGTSRDNTIDAFNKGRRVGPKHDPDKFKGTLNPNSRVTDDMRKEIIKMYLNGDKVIEICNKFDISTSTVRVIAKDEGIIRSIGAPKGTATRTGKFKLSKNQIQDILYRYSLGDIKQSTLANEYGVTQSTISNIIRNNYKNG